MISNRVVFYMTLLVLIGMGILFFLNLNQMREGTTGSGTYLKYNDVRGIAIKHKDLLYTLNFDQQNRIIDILNQSIQIQKIPAGQRQAPDFQQLIIYRFEDQPDLIITPTTYLNNELVYSMPQWNPNGYMKEVSVGELRKLISQTYDH